MLLFLMIKRSKSVEAIFIQHGNIKNRDIIKSQFKLIGLL